MTYSHRVALTTRTRLLASEANIVAEQRITWRQRLEALGDYGTSGGTAGKRRLIVEAMAELEAER